jgi:fucokinase
MTAASNSSLPTRAHARFAARVAGDQTLPWWTAVVLTASSALQAERYREEIRRRQAAGHLPTGVVYLVVPDPEDRRIGSGSATLWALRALVEEYVSSHGSANPGSANPGSANPGSARLLPSNTDLQEIPQGSAGASHSQGSAGASYSQGSHSQGSAGASRSQGSHSQGSAGASRSQGSAGASRSQGSHSQGSAGASYSQGSAGASRSQGSRSLGSAGASRSQDVLTAWWATQRVLLLHSGGDSRRLPQYSLVGKLFSVLPVTTPWGQTSTVFDETLALSTLWVERLPAGLVVGSGDVLLTFDPGALRWARPGVCGVAMETPLAVGSQHGVYVADDAGRVYAFLQKPSREQVAAAGGLLPEERVAVDTGLLRFDPPTAACLTELGGVTRTAAGWEFGAGLLAPTPDGPPVIDLYEHITKALTGDWTPAPDATPPWHRLAAALRDRPFWVDRVAGEFIHVGTTRLFQQLMTRESALSRQYAHERVGMVTPPGVHSAGAIIDSVLAPGSTLDTDALAIECALAAPLSVARGGIAHGLMELTGPISVPEGLVVHQVPVRLPDGSRGTVIRAYGVEDDPKGHAADGTLTWLGRPIRDILALLALEPAEIWPDLPPAAHSLWEARLFPVTTPDAAWACVRWMCGEAAAFSRERWRATPRLSLAESARLADPQALADGQTRRLQTQWQQTTLALVQAGSDIRPLLAYAPGIQTLAATGRALSQHATALRPQALTEAASYAYQASLILAQAGVAAEADEARGQAFAAVTAAVEAGTPRAAFPTGPVRWRREAVRVAAPVRIDLGGGWSDTPPFCLDWGGSVLNLALTLEGAYPIQTTLRRLDTPRIRCISAETGDVAEFTTTADLCAPPDPGSPFAIPRMALQLWGLGDPTLTLPAQLAACGGGLEITLSVTLPMGSGLGTSSILAATLLHALATMTEQPVSASHLGDQVMCLEQRLTTGGGWQDQAGGIYPGAKLITSGPGLRQRLRIQPVAWSPEQQAAFQGRFVLYYTGLRRIAKNLLTQVVGKYLAREVASVQALHSIKTLASEMAFALQEAEWDYLGELLTRHWHLNLQLDPHTTNAPINALLEALQPHLAGAKLAGAGGGGYLLLLARSPEAAETLRQTLRAADLPGRLTDYALATTGLHVVE